VITKTWYPSYLSSSSSAFVLSMVKPNPLLVYKGAAVTSAAVALTVEKGIDIVFFEAKIRNQSFLLKILAKDRNNDQLKDRAEKLMSLTEKLECSRTIKEARQKFMGWKEKPQDNILAPCRICSTHFWVTDTAFFLQMKRILTHLLKVENSLGKAVEECDDEQLRPFITKNIASSLCVKPQSIIPNLRVLESDRLIQSRRGAVKRGELFSRQ
jgi:hypothetical protein